MKAIVNRALNERIEPSVNATVTNTYEVNQELEVLASMSGDDYDGDDTWYQLDNGNYVWSGAVDLIGDDSGLKEEDKVQYLISYRKVFGNGSPDMNSTEVPNTLYFTPVRIGTSQSSIRLNEIVPTAFVTSVVQSVVNLPAKQRHVFIYIHGFQAIFPSLGLPLLEKFTRNYMTHPENKIAKVLLMTWPAQSFNRKFVDERAIEAGRHFTAHNLFNVFKELSEALALVNKSLNLVTHSFAHQLLNGMINPLPQLTPGVGKIFENIFLMAPDVTYLSVKQGGAKLPNYYNAGGEPDHVYNYQNLHDLADHIHVFHDEHDFVLYTSTKKFVSDPSSMAQTNGYRNLGNYGETLLAGPDIQPNLNFKNVGKLPSAQPPIPMLYYPFQSIRNGPGRAIERARQFGDYSGITLTRVIFNLGRFTDRHRYLFTCKAVVDEILRILK